jgi:metal-responsive CopG/Arc/MetJ family transcriptional regulator
MNEHLSVRVPNGMKEKIDALIEKGLYFDVSDLIRETLRKKIEECSCGSQGICDIQGLFVECPQCHQCFPIKDHVKNP